jgi:hypothetical protein
MIGPSSMYSTIEDMAKWVINFKHQEIGGKEVFDLMFQKGKLNDGKEISYACGARINEYRGTKTIDHDGGGSGFSTIVMHLPEYNYSVVILYNTYLDVHKTIREIIDVYLGDKLNPFEESNQQDNEKTEIKILAKKLDKFIGTYKIFQGWYMTISRKDNQLMALETNKDIYPITALSETEFYLEPWNQSLVFTIDKNGEVTELKFLGMECPRVEKEPTPSFTPISKDLEGDYYCEELNARYTIEINEEKLIVKHNKHGIADLTPAWKDSYRCDWWFMRSVEFIRDEQGMISGLNVTQWQSRNYKFVKI